jgi:hypothetical protein
LTVNKIFIQAPKIMRKVATCNDLVLLMKSRSNCVFQILQEVGAEREKNPFKSDLHTSIYICSLCTVSF